MRAFNRQNNEERYTPSVHENRHPREISASPPVIKKEKFPNGVWCFLQKSIERPNAKK